MIILSNESEEGLVLFQSHQNVDKTLFTNIVIADDDLLETRVPLENIGNLFAAAILERILAQVQMSKAFTNFNGACNMLEPIICQINTDQL